MKFNFNLNEILDTKETEYTGINYNESESKDFIIDKTGGEFNLRVFAPLVFEPLIKNDLNLPSLRIDAVTVNLNRSKIIKKEGIEGRDSTIKEHITNGDFSISI